MSRKECYHSASLQNESCQFTTQAASGGIATYSNCKQNTEKEPYKITHLKCSLHCTYNIYKTPKSILPDLSFSVFRLIYLNSNAFLSFQRVSKTYHFTTPTASPVSSSHLPAALESVVNFLPFKLTQAPALPTSPYRDVQMHCCLTYMAKFFI